MMRAYLLFGVTVFLAAATATSALAADDQARTAEAQKAYEDLVYAYMHYDSASWDTAYKEASKQYNSFSTKQKGDVSYMRRTAAEFRPTWWKNCKSSTSVSFPAVIWGKTITANYMPTSMLGAQQLVYDPDTQKFHVVVTWQPHMVDSLRPLGGDAAKTHQMREGDQAEAIIWHELGHNYITVGFSTDQIVELYTKYEILFRSLQEFYADMSALYHCSPPGRKVTMMLRISEMFEDSALESHTRGARGIGSYMLATVLTEPEKWPSFHLPTAVPETDVERRTILYMYEHIDPHYTLDEDRNLREMVGNLVMKQGGNIFRTKGTIPLPSKLQYKITTSEDRDLQIQRDKWVAEMLKKAIDSGAVAKVQKTEGHPKRFRLPTTW
jgi:hypothetical protein